MKKPYLIREFERLKKDETYRYKVEWHANRILAKANYLIHTDAIKEKLIPTLTARQRNFVYASEADVLNVALFGMTAKEWRDQNPELAKTSNIRDNTDLLHLTILNNLENINAELIRLGFSQSERLERLNQTAKKQIDILRKNKSFQSLQEAEEDNKLISGGEDE